MNRKEFNQKYLNINKEEFVLEDKISDIKKIKKNLKFYKYYDLEDKHTIENIENGIIHFSNPQGFNDPFDCSCSFDFDSFLKYYFIKLIIDIFEDDGIIYPLLKGYIEKRINDDLLKQVGLNILERLEINVEDFDENIFYSRFQDYLSKYMHKVSEKCHTKYIPSLNLINEFTVQNSETLLNLLDENYLLFMKKVSKIIANDENNRPQLDVLVYFEQYIDEKSKIFADLIKSKIRVFCFADRYDNPLMWAHYSNKHQGICVEYELGLSDENLIANLFPVEYQTKRPTLTKKIFDDQKINNFIMSCITTKSSYWKYEKEWRVLLPNNDILINDNFKSPKIIRVFFGVNISEKKYNEISTKIHEFDNNIECIKMKMHYKEYKICKE